MRNRACCAWLPSPWPLSQGREHEDFSLLHWQKACEIGAQHTITCRRVPRLLQHCIWELLLRSLHQLFRKTLRRTKHPNRRVAVASGDLTMKKPFQPFSISTSRLKASQAHHKGRQSVEARPIQLTSISPSSVSTLISFSDETIVHEIMYIVYLIQFYKSFWIEMKMFPLYVKQEDGQDTSWKNLLERTEGCPKCLALNQELSFQRSNFANYFPCQT